jgi:hypothetical protein
VQATEKGRSMRRFERLEYFHNMQPIHACLHKHHPFGPRLRLAVHSHSRLLRRLQRNNSLDLLQREFRPACSKGLWQQNRNIRFQFFEGVDLSMT